MASEIFLSVFVVFCVFTVQITGQLCSPKGVENLTLTVEGLLTWEPPNDSCNINYYLVNVHNTNHGNREFYFATPSTALRTDFLPICERYQFIIVAVSTEGVRGSQSEHTAKVPFPLDADLSIELFSISPRSGALFLDWKVSDEWANCADRYRVTIYDGEGDNPIDLYVYNNNATISGLVPCTNYIFGLRAIYNLQSEGPYTSTRYPFPAAGISAPTLRSITVGSTTADLVWNVESYSRNRCTVSSLTVDASPYFRITYPITDQINRPPVSVRLTSLTPDTMYLLNVTLTNTAGTSAPTLIAVQTLEN